MNKLPVTFVIPFIKLILLVFIAVMIGCKTDQKHLIHSNVSNIRIVVNGKTVDWTISPETDPDRYRVYCPTNQNEVVFITDRDSIAYSLYPFDTLKINIVLKEKDTARTEIIGLREIPNSISTDEKIYWFSQLWSETKYNFVNIDRLDFDLDSLYLDMIPEIMQSANDFEFYRTMKKFAASLHDGHTQVSDGGQFFAYRDYIPLSVADFDNKMIITRVRKIPGQDSTWVGAEILKIDEIPTYEYLINNAFPYISASTEQHLWMQSLYHIQNGFKDQPFKATIRKQNGDMEDIVIPRNGETIRTPEDKYWGPEYKYSRNLVELEWLENDIALVGFHRFYPEKPAIAEFDAIADQLDKAEGVIIDLRNNGGGSTEVAWFLQGHLEKGDDFLNYGWESRQNDGVKKANGNWKEEYEEYFLNKALRFESPEVISIPDSINRIECPVVILIGRFTFSAAEDFLVNLYEVPGRPMLVGEETGGSTGSPLFIPGLPGDGYIRICTRRICYPISGKRFVNQGILPDIEMKQSLDDYLEGRDVVLEKALEVLKGL